MLLKNCRLADGKVVDIAVRDGKIAEVGVGLTAEGPVNDCEEKLVAPGFVDIHMHLDKTLIALDTPNDSGTLEEAIRITQSRKKKFTKGEVKSRAQKTLDKAIASGTTWIRTNVDIDPLANLVGLEALLELREEYKERITLELVAFPQEGINKSPGTLELLEEALNMGADILGGIPAKDTEPELHVHKIFDLAEKYAVPLDIHTDESDNPEDLTVLEIAAQTVKRGMQGRVTVAHCCSLAALAPDKLEQVLEELAPARLNFVSLPSTNLYLQGRRDSHKVRRGIAPVKALLAKGFNVAFASDNVRDAFNPFGNANPLQTALLAAHGCHMGGTAELEQIFAMLTCTPGKIVGGANEVAPGNIANLVVLSAGDVVQAIIEQASVAERIFWGEPDGRWFGNK